MFKFKTEAVVMRTSQEGEGNFREYTISRYLWDLHDPVSGNDDGADRRPATDGVDGGFQKVWASLVRERGWNQKPRCGLSVCGTF